MPLYLLFADLKTKVTDFKKIENQCQNALMALTQNIEKIDERLRILSQSPSKNKDALSSKSLLMRKRIDEMNKIRKLETMLAERPAFQPLLNYLDNADQTYKISK
jgi:hypothetical protein